MTPTPHLTVDLTHIGQQARMAFRVVSRLSGDQRAAAVTKIAQALQQASPTILAANAQDVALAQAKALNPALIDRLTLNEARLQALLRDVDALAAMPDPVGRISDERSLPSGIRVKRIQVPLGVMGVIYESRPNVTIDIATLSIKTGNCAILRGGSETLNTNRALVAAIQTGLTLANLPITAVQFIDSADRELVTEMLRLDSAIDVIIPRGGAGLHAFCRANSTIPVITGGIGICHLYVDASADLQAALPLIYNAKVQRPSVCNALDTLLVNAQISEQFLPKVVEHLSAAGVSFRAEPRAMQLLNHPAVLPAGPDDFDTEWLSLTLGLKVIDNLDEAIAHIDRHSTGHSDGILSATAAHIAQFVAQVDSAGVFVNASTRFNDGGQLGLGAEVAVSTQRLHARGPMGLPELTTYKWIIEGDYTIRA